MVAKDYIVEITLNTGRKLFFEGGTTLDAAYKVRCREENKRGPSGYRRSAIRSVPALTS